MMTGFRKEGSRRRSIQYRHRETLPGGRVYDPAANLPTLGIGRAMNPNLRRRDDEEAFD
jgi:hypothetical protein